MPDIVVQFTGQELDEMIARAATLSVGKHGFEASACDVATLSMRLIRYTQRRSGVLRLLFVTPLNANTTLLNL